MGYGTGTDPLDPLGKSGEFIPSPEDTGFFDISEQEMAQIDMDNRSIKRKHKGGHGLRNFLIFLLFVLLIGGAAAFGYYSGYGWPLQESVVEELLADSLTEEEVLDIQAVLPDGATGVTGSGVDRAMSESSAMATATLSAGGEQSYLVTLVRDGLGWKVDGVTVEYPALDGGDAYLDTDEYLEGEGTTAEDGTAEASGEATEDGAATTTGSL